MIFEAAAKGEAKIGVVGGGLLHLAGLGSTDAREMSELMYEFEEPLLLDGTKFLQEFPDFKFTPHEEAMETTLQWFQQHHAAADA